MENHSEYGLLPTLRLRDGTVDFDYYEARARVLRREAGQAFGRRVAGALGRLWALAQSAWQKPRSALSTR